VNYIDITDKKIIAAHQNHFDELMILLLDRLEKYLTPVNVLYSDWIADNIEAILLGSPQEILNLHFKVLPFKYYGYNPLIEKVFNYTSWFTSKKETIYDAYELAKNLDINSCTYCNRQYTKTVVKGKDKITRPQFDHWFPKEDYPLLALSFYNLIPSCSTCNASIKGRSQMTLIDHLHPYVDSGRSIIFGFDMKTHNTHDFKVKDGGDRKVRNTINFFKIQEIYETHMDEIDDLVKIKKKYSTAYLSNLRRILKDTSISNEEIYRLAFSTYINDKDFDKRPLSRMKRDLLRELRIIP